MRENTPRLGFLYCLCFVSCLLLSVGYADAADLWCGRDTDRNGTITLCPGLDKDFDLYNSVADGGTDCDDTNPAIYPGAYTTSGCSAGQSRLCQTSGSYTSCVADASFVCHGSGGTTWFVDDSGPSTTNCSLDAGTYADPKDYRCFFNTSMTGYAALGTKDCLVFLAGIYSTSWGSSPARMVYTNVTGDATQKARITNLPGASVLLDGAGVSPNNVYPVELATDNYDIQGLEIDGNYSSAGILLSGSSGNHIHRNYIHDVAGGCISPTPGDNCGGIRLSSSSNNNNIELNDVRDVFNPTQPTNENANAIQVFRGTGNRFAANTLGSSNTSQQYAGFYYKHCETSGNGSYNTIGNLIYNGAGHQLVTNCGGGTITRNTFVGTKAGAHAVYAHGGSGATYFAGGLNITYNTGLVSPGPILFDQGSYEQSDSFGPVLVSNNVWNDDAAAYSDDYFYSICRYCSDAIYTIIIGGGVITNRNNLHFNTLGTALPYTVFGDNGSTSFGTTYASFALWSANLLTYLTSGEINTDPLFDSAYIAQVPAASNMGWRNTATDPTVKQVYGSRTRGRY